MIFWNASVRAHFYTQLLSDRVDPAFVVILDTSFLCRYTADGETSVSVRERARVCVCGVCVRACVGWYMIASSSWLSDMLLRIISSKPLPVSMLVCLVFFLMVCLPVVFFILC